MITASGAGSHSPSSRETEEHQDGTVEAHHIVVRASRPIRVPTFSLRIVVSLSTISRDVALRPFVALGSTVRRSKGASVGSLVRGRPVIHAVAAKRSSCTITTGLGL